MSDNIQEVEVTARADGHLVEYDPIEAGLAELREKYRGKVYDCTIVEQEREAREARMALSRLNGKLDAVHKAIKEPALRRCQLIDGVKRKIAEQIQVLREPIHAQITAEEARKEKLEEERVAGIRRAINLACLVGVSSRSSTRQELEEAIFALDALRFDETFAEFVEEAAGVRARELSACRQLLLERIKADEEAAKVAAERAELARQKAEQEAAAKVERERLAAERAESERKAEEKRKADQMRLDGEREELRRKREALDAEEAKAKAARAEADAKADAERKEKDRLADVARAAEAKRIADAQAALDRAKEAEREEIRQAQERADAAEKRVRDAAPSMVCALNAVSEDPQFGGLADAVQELVLDALKEAVEA